MKTVVKRRIAVAAAGVLGVLILAVSAFLLLFPAERIGAMAAERASIALDRDVEVDRIGLSVFPAPAVALDGITIGPPRAVSAEGGLPVSGTPLARIERVEARPRILPLLRGRIEVHSLILDRPRVAIDPGQLAGGEPADREAGPGFFDDATFRVRGIHVREGTLEYQDTTGTVRLDRIDQRLEVEAELADGALARLLLTGDLAVERLSAEMPRHLATPIQDLRLELRHRITADLRDETATVEQLALQLRELELTGSGWVRNWSDAAERTVSLQLESSGDVAPLLASLPARMRTLPAGDGPETELRATSGTARLAATIDGRLGDDQVPHVDGNLDLDGVGIASGSDRLIEDLRGAIVFTLDSILTPELTAIVLGEPVRLSARIDDLSAPLLAGTLAGRLDLGEVTRLGLLPDGTSGAGLLAVDLQAEGPATEPSELILTGSIDIAGISYASEERPTVEVLDGRIQFVDSELIARGISMSLGTSDFTADAAASAWLPAMLGDTMATPRLVFETRSRSIDADALFPPDPQAPTYAELFFARLAGRQVDGVSASEAAARAGFELPELPKATIDGRIRAERVVQRGHEFRDLDLELAGRDGQVDLRNASFRLMGGGIELGARLGAARPETAGGRTAPLSLSFSLGDVEAATFLQRFTPFREHLDGAMQLAGALTVRLDEHLLPDPATLAGNGSISIADGRIANWRILREFADRAGIASFDTIAFRDWSGSFQMIGSRFVLDETNLRGERVDLDLGGWFDVSGQLDLGATVHLNAALAALARQGPVASLVDASLDPEGRLPVGVRITGTASQPSVRLDLSETRERVVQQARERAEEEARDLARTLAGEAAERLVPADSVGVPTSPREALDTVQQRVQDAVVGRLRGLLRPGTPTPATEADTADASPTVPEAAADTVGEEDEGTPSP